MVNVFAVTRAQRSQKGRDRVDDEREISSETITSGPYSCLDGGTISATMSTADVSSTIASPQYSCLDGGTISATMSTADVSSTIASPPSQRRLLPLFDDGDQGQQPPSEELPATASSLQGGNASRVMGSQTRAHARQPPVPAPTSAIVR
jgi:hypothetical protein